MDSKVLTSAQEERRACHNMMPGESNKLLLEEKLVVCYREKQVDATRSQDLTGKPVLPRERDIVVGGYRHVEKRIYRACIMFSTKTIT